MIRRVKNIIFLSVIFLTYLFFSSGFKFQFLTTSSNYFSYLAEAFNQGRLDLVSQPKNILDLVFFNKKLFLYWPPLPAIVLMPWIAVFGKNISDVLYTSIVGSLNCIVFYFLLAQIRKSRLIKFSQKSQILAVLFFSFGTIHFYLSLFGRVWFTSQIFSLLFFLCSFWGIFKYYNLKKSREDKKKLAYLVFTSLCLCLSFIARNTFVFSLPFFLTMIFLKNKSVLKKSLKKVFVFLVFPLLTFILNCLYNFFRFNSFWENGYHYHLFNPQFSDHASSFGLFNLVYLPINLYYNFLNPLKFKLSFPFIQPNPLGNSLFFTSPLFLYLFFLKKFWPKNKKEKIFLSSILFSCLLMILPAMFLFGTGWFQFGSRYLLDIIPFLILLVLITVDNFKSRFSLFLLAVSVFINLMAYFWWKNLNI